MWLPSSGSVSDPSKKPTETGGKLSLYSRSTSTEMSTTSRKIMFLGSRAPPVRRADNLTAIYEAIVQIMWDP
jgi:hypothetical protein